MLWHLKFRFEFQHSSNYNVRWNLAVGRDNASTAGNQFLVYDIVIDQHVLRLKVMPLLRCTETLNYSYQFIQGLIC